MRAANFLGNGRIKIKEIEKPFPKADEVLVRVLRCALCGSDKRLWQEGTNNIPGHEIVAIVEDKNSILDGKRVLVYIPVYCDNCPQCNSGNMNQCPNITDLVGWQRPGGYADYISLPERVLLPIPDEIPTDLAPLLLDTIGTTAHGIRMGMKVKKPGKSLILGTGPIGLGSLLVLKGMGFNDIACFDPNEKRQEFAISLGARKPQENEKFDMVIEASGHQNSRNEAMLSVASNGCVLLFGESASNFVIEPTPQIRRKDFYVLRSFYFPINDLKENINLLFNNKELYERLVDKIFPLEELEECFQQFVEGKLIKPVVNLEL